MLRKMPLKDQIVLFSLLVVNQDHSWCCIWVNMWGMSTILRHYDWCCNPPLAQIIMAFLMLEGVEKCCLHSLLLFSNAFLLFQNQNLKGSPPKRRALCVMVLLAFVMLNYDRLRWGSFPTPSSGNNIPRGGFKTEMRPLIFILKIWWLTEVNR